mgnify:CR=1 FL=1
MLDYWSSLYGDEGYPFPREGQRGSGSSRTEQSDPLSSGCSFEDGSGHGSGSGFNSGNGKGGSNGVDFGGTELGDGVGQGAGKCAGNLFGRGGSKDEPYF